MLVEVSIGELLDKYSILRIKLDNIRDPIKLTSVREEISHLQVHVGDKTNSLVYTLLLAVNRLIWDLTDEIGESSNDIEVYRQVFYLNKCRFRCKTHINKVYSSKISEEKNNYDGKKFSPFYIESYCKSANLDLIYHIIQSDSVEVICSESDIDMVRADFKDFNIKYTLGRGYKNVFQRHKYLNGLKLESREPINYVVGGMLGDAIHSLYVIKMMYVTYGRKGILYLTDDRRFGGDNFTTGLKRTYEELYPIVIKQEYIEKFLTLSHGDTIPEQIVNLNAFRWSRDLNLSNWPTLLSKIYNLPISYEPWITLKDKESGKILGRDNRGGSVLIHRSLKRRYTYSYRTKVEPVINSSSKCNFITCNLPEYDNFTLVFPDINGIICNNLESMFTNIDRCDLFIGNQSSPLAIAASLGKSIVCEHTEGQFYKDLPNVKIL